MEDHDEDPAQKRFVALFKVMLGAQLDIVDMLAALPLPIVVEPVDEDWDPLAGLPAMDRVRTVIRDEPVDSRLANLISALILDWLAAYDVAGAFQALGPAPWRLDAMEAAMIRVASGLHLVKGLLRRENGG